MSSKLVYPWLGASPESRQIQPGRTRDPPERVAGELVSSRTRAIPSGSE